MPSMAHVQIVITSTLTVYGFSPTRRLRDWIRRLSSCYQ